MRIALTRFLARTSTSRGLTLSRSAVTLAPGTSFPSSTGIDGNNGNFVVLSYARHFSSAASLVQLVKDLRAMTGAPMMECKKALQESENDLQKATEWLRSHGSAKLSSKLEGRETSEGMVGLLVSPDASRAALVKVSSETDFASRSETFASLMETIAFATICYGQSGTVDVESVLSLAIPSEAPLSHFKSVKEALEDTKLAIRENLSISSARAFTTDEGPLSVLAGYVHNRSPHSLNAGTAAAVVQLSSTDDRSKSIEQLQEIGKKLAMHIVAAKPKYLSPEDVPADVLEKEKEILKEQIATSGKKDQKPEVIEKIITGRLNKFYEDVCLTHQPHMVEEGNPIVSKYLNGLGLKVKQFELVLV